MSALQKRIFSALGALFLICAIYYFARAKGLMFLCSAIILVGSYEYWRMLLRPIIPSSFLRGLFLFICANILFISIVFPAQSNWAVIPFFLYFVFFCLWAYHKEFEIQKILNFCAFGSLGFIYTAWVPAQAIRIIQMPKGDIWFLLLLCLVFAGDISAYFGGITFGRAKIMPRISPSKTWAGGIFGLIGSVIITLLINHYFQLSIATWTCVGFALVTGLLAQTGDFFESLLKRVANVKDSGQIMPGHGGVLDRLDGVYFAAPLIYILAQMTST